MSQKDFIHFSRNLPYVDETQISNTSRYLPQAIQRKGWNTCIYAKYGSINEREINYTRLSAFRV